MILVYRLGMCLVSTLENYYLQGSTDFPKMQEQPQIPGQKGDTMQFPY